ncbi:MAG: hypothetical protein GY866_38960 [Proteobacteria bacterium]|nr:hypothetical protein [Pseudomonadota bacterium]
MDESKDHLKHRCPRLGGPVFFLYCRTCGDDGLPCWKTVDCWWEQFEITDFLKENLSEADWTKLMAARIEPPAKVASLVDLIEKAKKRI